MKKLIIGIVILILFVDPVHATSSFDIDVNKIDLNNGKTIEVTNNFKDKYLIDHDTTKNNDKLEKEIGLLTKKITYLLLGESDKKKETSETYMKRKKEFLSLRYNPIVPKKADGTLDETSKEYTDDLVSGLSVVSNMFIQFDELNAVYKDLNDIKVVKAQNVVISKITLSNVLLNETDENQPMKYKSKTTNLVIYYYFKELNGKYKLYTLMGETGEGIENYYQEVESSENSNLMAINASYESDISSIYNYDKLNALSSDSVKKIYNSNINKILILNTYYNNAIVDTATGFFINKGLIVTTWDYLEYALSHGQYVLLRDNMNNSYEMDGIVSANPEANMAIIKLKENVGEGIVFGNSNAVKYEDPVITINSKNGVGLTLQKGIVISKDRGIKSLLPLFETDEGSPLLDSKGNVIGINTSDSINTSISYAVETDCLKKVQTKFNATDFKNIDTISFDELKEKYYYSSTNSEIISNNISNNKWKKYKKVGNIENTIKLKLVKASYTDGIVSLRYVNKASDFISSMHLSSPFKKALITQKFKETLSSDRKSILISNDYKV
ncbi:MAG: serine protease, partial [Bacilli bacterium]